jgi:hypothetical protein
VIADDAMDDGGDIGGIGIDEPNKGRFGAFFSSRRAVASVKILTSFPLSLKRLYYNNTENPPKVSPAHKKLQGAGH